ncbi:hypothetical protein SIN8267_00259 [Sinobacterium norvegicum]|uniref:DUF3127 domain-containing protein n=1 Tax=Sinobacterium norvegicum TaxID=1641715 RepID=A0ABN8EGK3_9GAMM|nr:DUF3127 domain-containing protein [Sinobacterium norvegicum]CAH0990174.1 hypothetical protein SIN8267_00259 [Sinobacterium norvegicum]
MSKSFEVQGEVHSIGQTTEYGNNGFTKREFVIKLTGEGENAAYPNYVALELIKDKCALMDQYKIGDELVAHFNLSGRLWAGNGNGERCFTSLQAWRIESANNNAAADAGYGGQAMPDYDSFDQTPPSAPQPQVQQTNASTAAYDDDIPF